MTEERRSPVFIEHLSIIIVFFAGLGALLVLIDPVLTLNVIGGNTVKIGGNGFSEQLKGAVVQSLMIGGFTAAVQYWLGSTAGGQRQQETVARIAEASAPSTAAAVAATVAASTAAATPGTAIPLVPVETQPAAP